MEQSGDQTATTFQAGLLPLTVEREPRARGVLDETFARVSEAMREALAPAIARVWQTGRNYGLELRGPETGADWYRSFRSRHPGEAAPQLELFEDDATYQRRKRIPLYLIMAGCKNPA